MAYYVATITMIQIFSQIHPSFKSLKCVTALNFFTLIRKILFKPPHLPNLRELKLGVDFVGVVRVQFLALWKIFCC